MRALFYSSILFISFVLILSSCGRSSHSTLKVAATSVPHAEILEQVQSHLEAQGIALEILTIDDFNTPNRALAEGEVDANFFQHLPFLEAQQADFGYQLENLVAVHLEPMALYSKKYHALEEIKEGMVIALPIDPSNQARALALLEQAGLLTLTSQGTKGCLLDIASNPYKLELIEMDSPLLSRALDDVDAAAISTNFALLAGLSPKADALIIENGQSSFANCVVVRTGESQRPELQLLKAALTTEQISQWMKEHYQGAVIPAF